MLVLSRKRGEKIVVTDQNIVITVLEVRGSHVRLGIQAPRQVTVLRGEVSDRQAAQERETTASGKM